MCEEIQKLARALQASPPKSFSEMISDSIEKLVMDDGMMSENKH